VPFLEGVPDETAIWLRAYGEMSDFRPGQCIVPPNVSRGGGGGCARAGGRAPRPVTAALLSCPQMSLSLTIRAVWQGRKAPK
jgi:hypothetical protein